MAGVEVNTEHWPMLLVKFDGEQTMDDVDFFIAQMKKAHARRERYASISLMRKYANKREHVQKVARFMKETYDATRELCVCNGIVSQSLGFRFLLSTIFLVKPMPCPYNVCASFDEAMSWVREVAAKKDFVVGEVPNIWNV